MRPMLHTDDEFGDAMVADRPRTSIGTTIALVVIIVALVGAMFLLVMAGTDGIDAGPAVTTPVQTETPTQGAGS